MKISVKVIVYAKRSEVIEEGFDLFGNKFLKIKVNQLPEDGKANREVIRLIAEHFSVKINNVRIIRGETSTSKIVEVDNV